MSTLIDVLAKLPQEVLINTRITPEEIVLPTRLDASELAVTLHDQINAPTLTDEKLIYVACLIVPMGMKSITELLLGH